MYRCEPESAWHEVEGRTTGCFDDVKVIVHHRRLCLRRQPLAPSLAAGSADGRPNFVRTRRGKAGGPPASDDQMSEPGAGKRTSGGSCAVRSGEAGGDCSHRERGSRDDERRADKTSERGSGGGGGGRRKAKRKRSDETSAPGPTTGTASRGAVHQPKGGGGRKKKRKRSRSAGRGASARSAPAAGAAPEAAAGPRRAPTGTCALGGGRHREGRGFSSEPPNKKACFIEAGSERLLFQIVAGLGQKTRNARAKTPQKWGDGRRV
jgi:hypothetical protein